MTPGAAAARAGLDRSVGDNAGQMAMTDESRRLLADLLEERMRIAVAEGIGAMLTDENAERFWRTGIQVLQEQAAKQAGMLLWGGVKRVLGVGAIVLLVWLVAGAPAAKVVLGALSKGGA